MATFIVEDKLPRNQYTAAASQTVFTYNFLLIKETDIDVYQTPAGSIGNDAADILILNADYTVTGVGNTGGGTIVLTVGATVNDILTLQRNSPVQRLTDFNPGNFTPDQLNIELDSQVTFTQDNEMRISRLSIRYQDSSEIDVTRDVNLPILGPSEYWQMNAPGTGIITAKLEPNADVNTLRSELADNGVGSDGARIVGFESTTFGSTTVHDQFDTNIANIDANTSAIAAIVAGIDENNLIIGGNFTTNPFQRATTITSTGSFFVADRFKFTQEGAVTNNTCGRVADAIPLVTSNNFESPLALEALVVNAIVSPAAGDYFGYEYAVEGFDFAEVFTNEFTLEFFVKSAVTGTFSVGFQNETQAQFYVSEYTVLVANTWEKKSITVSEVGSASGVWNVQSGIGLRIFFNMASGSTFTTSTLDAWGTGADVRASTNQANVLSSAANNFLINLVTLNKGSSGAPAYPHRHASTEIALCQRYYEQSYPFEQANAVTPTGAHITVVNKGTGTDDLATTVSYKAVKALNPTISIRDELGVANQWTGIFGTIQAVPLTLTSASESSFSAYNVLLPNATTVVRGHWIAESELI